MAYELLSQSRKLNKRGGGGVLIKAEGLENFLKINKQGGGGGAY